MAETRPESNTRSADKEYERVVMDLNASWGYFGPAGNKDKYRKRRMLETGLVRIGMTLDEVDRLSVIHIAGTKGKGSTCAFVERILREHGFKTGVFRASRCRHFRISREAIFIDGLERDTRVDDVIYTAPQNSPHLIESRERIQINGQPVDKDTFVTAFWFVHERLIATKAEYEDWMPGYFAISLLMAFYIFSRVENVDVAIVEVGMGGEYDATNVVQRPLVCGVTSLHLEHTDVLGNTVDDIAWHKAGIFKEGVPAITVPQEPESVTEKILERAKERKCPLYIIGTPVKTGEQEDRIRLGVAGGKQPYNASLAVEIANFWLKAKNEQPETRLYNMTDTMTLVDVPRLDIINDNLDDRTVAGLSKCRLPGRAQVLKKDGVTYYLDGAHTVDSMKQCVEWFTEAAEKERSQIEGRVARSLVFRMKQKKTASKHLVCLKDCGFDVTAFCPHVISTTARLEFKDSMDAQQNTEEAIKIAADQLSDWETILATNPAGDNPRPACVSESFPSTAAALWWASLMREKSVVKNGMTVDSLAKADLGLVTAEGGSTSPMVDVTRLDGLNDVVHVQVLVTGSFIMVGGALTLLHSHASIWE